MGLRKLDVASESVDELSKDRVVANQTAEKVRIG